MKKVNMCFEALDVLTMSNYGMLSQNMGVPKHPIVLKKNLYVGQDATDRK